MIRREFPRSVKAEIVHRAMLPDGKVKCEGCGLVLGKKTYHIDHTIPEAMFRDKSRPLTAKDGKLLGWDCCHKPKTAIDQGDLAKADRREAKFHGFDRKRSSFPKPPPGYRYDWKRRGLVKETI